ncbi:MAG: hypothetical protein V1789_03000 [PVC group bacterium]
MRLRTRRALSFAALTVFTIAALLLIAELGIDDLTDQNIETAIDGVKKLGEGDFSVAVDTGGSTETADLTRTFNRLESRLKEYLENLKKEMSAREAVHDFQPGGQFDDVTVTVLKRANPIIHKSG